MMALKTCLRFAADSTDEGFWNVSVTHADDMGQQHDDSSGFELKANRRDDLNLDSNSHSTDSDGAVIGNTGDTITFTCMSTNGTPIPYR